MGCAMDNACVFPASNASICALHQRDLAYIEECERRGIEAHSLTYATGNFPTSRALIAFVHDSFCDAQSYKEGEPNYRIIDTQPRRGGDQVMRKIYRHRGYERRKRLGELIPALGDEDRAKKRVYASRFYYRHREEILRKSRETPSTEDERRKAREYERRVRAAMTSDERHAYYQRVVERRKQRRAARHKL